MKDNIINKIKHGFYFVKKQLIFKPKMNKLIKFVQEHPEFGEYFKQQLDEMFPDGWWDAIAGFAVEMGTVGWDKALKSTLHKFHLDGIGLIYDELDWYDSDIFDMTLMDLIDMPVIGYGSDK